MANAFNKEVVGFLEVNCYLIPSEKENCVYIIDPGASPQQVAESAKKMGYDDYRILLTHGHIDHISAVSELMKLLPPIWLAFRGLPTPLQSSLCASSGAPKPK